jgi:hypothetical protein
LSAWAFVFDAENNFGSREKLAFKKVLGLSFRRITMAWKGPWGCYIHIPKTSGMWTKRVLATAGQGERDGMTHSLPLVWAHKRYFTIVRDPAEWLVSVFCNRRNSRWQDHPEKCPWADFCKVVMPYRTKDFEEFIDSVTTKLPGLVGWLYGCYTPPKVEAIRYGKEQLAFLKKLKCHPDRVAPVNVTGNKPDLTVRLREKVFEAELITYGRYGFFVDGTYLTRWRYK